MCLEIGTMKWRSHPLVARCRFTIHRCFISGTIWLLECSGCQRSEQNKSQGLREEEWRLVITPRISWTSVHQFHERIDGFGQAGNCCAYAAWKWTKHCRRVSMHRGKRTNQKTCRSANTNHPLIFLQELRCQMSSRTGCGWAYAKVLTSVFGLFAPVTRKSSANWCFRTVSKLVFSCHSGRFYSLSSFWVTMSIEVSTFLWINAHCEWLMFFFKKQLVRAGPMWNCVQGNRICSMVHNDNSKCSLHTAVKGHSLVHSLHKFVCQFVCLEKCQRCLSEKNALFVAQTYDQKFWPFWSVAGVINHINCLSWYKLVHWCSLQVKKLGSQVDSVSWPFRFAVSDDGSNNVPFEVPKPKISMFSSHWDIGDNHQSSHAMVHAKT